MDGKNTSHQFFVSLILFYVIVCSKSSNNKGGGLSKNFFFRILSFATTQNKTNILNKCFLFIIM